MQRECAAWLVSIPRKANPRKPSTYLLRRNVSTVPGHGTNYRRFADLPPIIREMITRIAAACGLPPDGLDKTYMAHLNIYPDGVGIGPHQDTEVHHKGAVISVTFLLGSNQTPSDFQVGTVRKAKGKKVFVAEHTLTPQTGDMILMLGKHFQDPELGWWHTVPTRRIKKMLGTLRVNITLRPCDLDSQGRFVWQNPRGRKRKATGALASGPEKRLEDGLPPKLRRLVAETRSHLPPNLQDAVVQCIAAGVARVGKLAEELAGCGHV